MKRVDLGVGGRESSSYLLQGGTHLPWERLRFTELVVSLPLSGDVSRVRICKI